MESKKIIGYTTGVFDLFHIGHLNLLKNAKSQCDFLIVGVTTDKLSRDVKNVKPVIQQNDRKKIVEAIKYVDTVIFQENYDKFDAFQKIKFDIMFVGDDWKGTLTWNKIEEDFKKVNVKIVYLKYSKQISSSILRKKLNFI